MLILEIGSGKPDWYSEHIHPFRAMIMSRAMFIHFRERMTVRMLDRDRRGRSVKPPTEHDGKR